VSPLPDPKPQEPQVQTIFNLPFPFDHDGIFDRKKPNLYLFELTKDVVAQIKVSVRAGYKGEITCRLYNLGDQGFSLEYYLGHEESGVCYITAALSPGSYQLQLQPDEKNVRYSVKATNGTGDGNDGFRQATLVTRDGVPKTASLLSNDYGDFFRFTVPKETEMMFSMSTSTSDAVSCIVYPLADVDLYGFSGPQCNVSYSYPEGTYMVGVYRTKSKASRQTYTIQLK
jgi:hypothetical protein